MSVKDVNILKYSFIQKLYNEGGSDIKFYESRNMAAGMFTKPSGKIVFKDVPNKIIFNEVPWDSLNYVFT